MLKTLFHFYIRGDLLDLFGLQNNHSILFCWKSAILSWFYSNITSLGTIKLELYSPTSLDICSYYLELFYKIPVPILWFSCSKSLDCTLYIYLIWHILHVLSINEYIILWHVNFQIWQYQLHIWCHLYLLNSQCDI